MDMALQRRDEIARGRAICIPCGGACPLLRVLNILGKLGVPINQPQFVFVACQVPKRLFKNRPGEGVEQVDHVDMVLELSRVGALYFHA